MTERQKRRAAKKRQPKWTTRLSFEVVLSDWRVAKQYKAAFKFLDKMNRDEMWRLRRAQVHAHSGRSSCRNFGRLASAGSGKMNLCWIKGLDKWILVHEMAHLTAGAHHNHDDRWASENMRLIQKYLKGRSRRHAIADAKERYNSFKRLVKETRRASRSTTRLPSFDTEAVYTQIN